MLLFTLCCPDSFAPKEISLQGVNVSTFTFTLHLEAKLHKEVKCYPTYISTTTTTNGEQISSETSDAEP